MTDPNTLPLPDLHRFLTADGLTRRLLELAKQEDLGSAGADITTRAMGITDRTLCARVVTRAPGVCAGLESLPGLRDVFAPDATITPLATDGQNIHAGQALAAIDGPAGQVLALERTLLNMLGRLCGVATLTRRHVDAVAGTGARVLDTRKTTPGLRAMEKYAVRCGGGHCHRIGLYDAVLIKDNHIALTGAPRDLVRTIRDAAQRARSESAPAFVEVEVDTLDQLDRILQIEPGLIDIVLLDNMPVSALCEAAARRDRHAPRLLLEASGGVTLETIGDIARSGVDRISVGALTHQAVSLDIGLDIAD